MTSTVYPMLEHHSPESVFAVWQGKPITTRQFVGHVQQVAAGLPEARHGVNLCEDRYLFLVGFVALLLRRQVNLLPPNRAPKVVEAVAADYPGSYCLVDAVLPELSLSQHTVRLDGYDGTGFSAPSLPIQLPAEQVVATVFTSGSTGQARANVKRWGELYLGAKLTEAAFALQDKEALTIVATVPPQHMFGLETSIILPLATALAVHGGRPFFPDDLRRVVAALDSQILLITTPVHLRTCVDAGLSWPALGGIISATAPLAAETAQRAESLFACEVSEIYGSTETGAIATRRTAHDTQWSLHDGLSLVVQDGVVQVNGGHLPQPVVLSDRLCLAADGRFTLEGRDSDMIKIAGKRASLGDLNHKLQSIPGVEDGVFFVPDVEPEQTVRLTALVVAPQLDNKTILAALQELIDPIYLPRPLYRVEHLPRNETGKLPRDALLALLANLRNH